ncbi:hypothetical protein Tco_0532004 [Tanacetum coccineum]
MITVRISLIKVTSSAIEVVTGFHPLSIQDLFGKVMQGLVHCTTLASTVEKAVLAYSPTQIDCFLRAWSRFGDLRKPFNEFRNTSKTLKIDESPLVS